MPDVVAFPAIGLIAAGLIALALVWPQGEGSVSPPPFGHPLAPLTQPAAAPTPASPAPPAVALRGPKPAAATVNGAVH